jgi:hypothetical protein
MSDLSTFVPLSYTEFVAPDEELEQLNYPVTFPYINRSHVSVLVDGLPAPYTWQDNGWIHLLAVPPTGVTIRVKRTTPSDVPLVDFQDGATLVESDLDMAIRQTFYLVQEALDEALLAGRIATEVQRMFAEILDMYNKMRGYFENGNFYWDYACTVPWSVLPDRTVFQAVLTEDLLLKGPFLRCKASTMSNLDSAAIYEIRLWEADFTNFELLGTITYSPGTHVGTFQRNPAHFVENAWQDKVLQTGKVLCVTLTQRAESMLDNAFILSFRRV